MARPDWYRALDRDATRWVASCAGAGWDAVGSTRLRGGTASAVDAVALQGPGGASTRLVLKRWLRPGWREDDPEMTPVREAAVLAALAEVDIPAPSVVAVDPEGKASGAPALLMTHLDGRRPSLADEARATRIGAMAETLTRIHDVRGPILAIVRPFQPYRLHDRLRIPTASRRPSVWRAAIAATASHPSVGPVDVDRFLHRDFHPANTVWRGARLIGVVDWASAAAGSVAVDLAHWRANLGTRHGIDIAERVLSAYTAAGGAVPVDQAWWDLRLLLDFLDAPDDLHGSELERSEAYLHGLLARV
jgi:hypothetical protein